MIVLRVESKILLYDSMGMSKKKRDPVKSAKAFVAKRGTEKRLCLGENVGGAHCRSYPLIGLMLV